MNILIVGVGNVLRSDDGFGVEVAKRLMSAEPRAYVGGQVTVAEAGIAGIQLIQELQDGYDAVVVIDTVDRQRPPGTVMVIDYEVLDVHELDHNEKYDLLADMHLATPERSLMVARALGVLPPIVRMVGVQPVDVESPAVGLSDTVAGAIEPAIEEIHRCVSELLERNAAHG
ncbi:MAG: hydrogenase maturation protease [Acidimicrobiales bacterium]